jgi:hypothetical protein
MCAPMRAALLMVLALAQFPNARQALDLGRTRDDALFDAFNSGYLLPAGGTLERAEVITEFRRAVLLVRDKYNLGEFGWTERDLAKVMTPYDGQVAFVAEVRLNPMHTYPNPPAYELYIATGPATKPLATKLKRDPIYPPGLGLGSAFVAVRLEGSFARADIEAAPEPMLTVIDEKANLVWQARIDLSRYR